MRAQFPCGSNYRVEFRYCLCPHMKEIRRRQISRGTAAMASLIIVIVAAAAAPPEHDRRLRTFGSQTLRPLRGSDTGSPAFGAKIMPASVISIAGAR
jgi:hypothetical protein